MRKRVVLLKAFSETEKVYSDSWMEGTKIVADVFTKEGSQRRELDEIVRNNVFSTGASWDNVVTCEEGEIKIRNLTTKRNRKNE